MLKKHIFQQKSSCDIFKSMLDMDLMCFGGRNTSHRLTLKLLPDPQPSQRPTPPSPLVNSCLFWRFLSYFYLQHGLGQKLVNTNLVDQNFGECNLFSKVAVSQILSSYDT